jgi:hypothetical protein
MPPSRLTGAASHEPVMALTSLGIRAATLGSSGSHPIE